MLESNVQLKFKMILERNLATEYDIKLIQTFKPITQDEFCNRILAHGFTMEDCLGWYNSYN